MGKAKYTEEFAKEFCEKIATSERGIHAIAGEMNVHPSTIFDWLNLHEEFTDRYARAKEMQADFMAAQMLNIADETTHDTITVKKKSGDSYDIPDKEWIDRSKLRVDARKWLLAKLAPRKYGDKLDVTTNGKDIPAPIIKMHPDTADEGN